MLTWPYVSVLLFVLASISIGRLFYLPKLDSEPLWHATLCLNFLAGSGVLGTLVYLLAHVGAARKGVFIAIAACSALVWIVRPIRRHAGTYIPASAIIPVVASSLFAGLYLVYATGPEYSPDAMDYHLVFVDLYKRSHGLVPVRDTYQAGFPPLMEMAFLYVYAISSDYRSCALVHLCFLFALSGVFLLVGKMLGSRQIGPSPIAFSPSLRLSVSTR
ncbi:MAG: hypothetical protein NTZ56_23280 [Acidobacteria bacterium]|nr:hypothetical protein [Acidobacteriota bacterium]